MKTKKFSAFLVLALLLIATPIYALALQDVPDVTDTSQLVLLLMPALSWVAVEVAKAIKKAATSTGIAGGWLLALVVPGLSALLAYVATLINPDLSWLAAFGLGLGSTLLDQIIKAVKNSE